MPLPRRFRPTTVASSDASCRKYNIFPILHQKEKGLLQFVQQFGFDQLQIEEIRLKFCILYKIDSPMRLILPFSCIKYSIRSVGVGLVAGTMTNECAGMRFWRILFASQVIRKAAAHAYCRMAPAMERFGEVLYRAHPFPGITQRSGNKQKDRSTTSLPGRCRVEEGQDQS